MEGQQPRPCNRLGYVRDLSHSTAGMLEMAIACWQSSRNVTITCNNSIVKALRKLSPIHRMAPWLRTYGSYQGRECSTRPCHSSERGNLALEHSELINPDAIGMSGLHYEGAVLRKPRTLLYNSSRAIISQSRRASDSRHQI